MNKDEKRVKKKKRNRIEFPILTISLTIFVFFIIMVTILFLFLLVFILVRTGVINILEDITVPIITIFFIISLVIGTVAALLMSFVPLRPINALLDAFNKVSSGDYSVRLELRGPQRIRDICNRFNNMVKELSYEEMLSNDFINNFSHEFKTPIVSIAGFAKMLKKQNVSIEEKDEYLDIIIDESQRLTDLSENVLNLSRLENQSILTGKERYNLTEQIRLVIALIYGKYPEKNIEFNFDCDEYYIAANEEMLKQVWINLLDNAMKFSYKNECIDVDISQDSNNTTVTISNTGDTISEENLTRIFNKFYQCDTSHTTKGNGLGLTIVRRILQLHNAEISVESKDFKTTFKIVFPEKKE